MAEPQNTKKMSMELDLDDTIKLDLTCINAHDNKYEAE